MSKPPILLSIDADFFSFEDFMWDWAHKEGMHPEVLWAIRLISTAMSGVDLVHETRLEKADFHPLKTLAVLREAGWQFSEHCQVTVSDSHMYAFPAFKSLAHARIVNIDAHHDLGYASKQIIQKRLKFGQLQCEDWLWFLLRAHVHMDAVTLYPNWKPGGDWPERPHWKGTSIEGRAQYRMFSMEALRELAGRVMHIHIARSQAWLPPWHDWIVPAMVSEMVSELSPARVAVYGDVDPLEPRDFDVERQQAQARSQAEFFRERAVQQLQMPST